MVKLILLCGFSLCAFSEPLLITSGHVNLDTFDVGWSFAGDGFSAAGFDDHFTNNCGFCFGPFQLAEPVLSTVNAANGFLILGNNAYKLPDLSFNFNSPFAVGSVFFKPQSILPTVTGAGTFDVPFNVGGSFCTTGDPHVFPPTPPNPVCISMIGSAVAHYTVIPTGQPNAFFQPLPTIDIVSPVPEPSTLGVGVVLIPLLLLGARRRSLYSRNARVEASGGCWEPGLAGVRTKTVRCGRINRVQGRSHHRI